MFWMQSPPFQYLISPTLKTRGACSWGILPREVVHYLLAAGLTLILSACGGGGGGSADSPSLTPAATSPTNDREVVTSTQLIAIPDTASTSENTRIKLYVLDNDSGFSESLPRITVVSNPENGTISIGDDGSVIYTPADGFSGKDSFVYRIDAGSKTSAISTASVTVTCTNSCPGKSQRITLQWNPVPRVLGYIVYFANGLVKNPSPITSVVKKPSVKFKPQTDLGLNSGEYACFWVQSVNSAGVSELSPPACGLV